MKTMEVMCVEGCKPIFQLQLDYLYGHINSYSTNVGSYCSKSIKSTNVAMDNLYVNTARGIV